VELSEWKGGRVVACDELSNAWNKTYCQQEKANDGVFWKMSPGRKGINCRDRSEGRTSAVQRSFSSFAR